MLCDGQTVLMCSYYFPEVANLANVVNLITLWDPSLAQVYGRNWESRPGRFLRYQAT